MAQPAFHNLVPCINLLLQLASIVARETHRRETLIYWDSTTFLTSFSYKRRLPLNQISNYFHKTFRITLTHRSTIVPRLLILVFNIPLKDSDIIHPLVP